MPIYTKPQYQLLTNLINEANPGLNLEPVTIENSRLGVPYPRTPGPGEIADTSIEVFPRDNSFFVGRVVVHYRRIDVGRLFANKVLKFDRWRGRNLTREDLADWINRRYDTTFVPSDISNSGWTSWSATRTTDIHPHSLCYQGTLSFQWDQGKRELDQVLNREPWELNPVYPQQDVRRWSGYHGALPTAGEEDDVRPLLTHVGFGLDYSRFYSILNALSNGKVIDSNDNILRTPLTQFTQATGIELSIDKDHTEIGGIAGLDFYRYSIPNGSLQEANVFDYMYAACINAKEDSWFGGRIMFHYNRENVQVPFKEVGFLEPLSFHHSTHDLSIRGETRYWELEEVHLDNYFPERVGRLGSYSGEFETSARDYSDVINFEFDYDTSIQTDRFVRFNVRRNNPSGTIVAYSPHFLFKVSIDVERSVSSMPYGDTVSIDVTNLPMRDGVELTWKALPVSGDWFHSVEGTTVVTDRKTAVDVTIPLTAFSDSVDEWVFELTDSEGEIVVTSDPFAVEGSVEITRTETYTDDFTLAVDAGTTVRYEVAGSGGGGAGAISNGYYGYESYADGGDGGDGALVKGAVAFEDAFTLTGSVPPGGEGGEFDIDGTTPDPTVLSLPDGDVEALGGEAGLTNNKSGEDASPVGGASGGIGGYYDNESISGQSGERGWITLEFLEKV